MSKVLKASQVAPAAFATDTTSDVLKEDDLTYDLGNLAAYDTHPFTYTNEKELLLHARENMQLLINKIFDAPREMTDVGPLAILPPPALVIPREKPLPKPKVETKWEKFAKEKFARENELNKKQKRKPKKKRKKKKASAYKLSACGRNLTVQQHAAASFNWLNA